jgi:serine/threonine protein phosphatase PrpC
MYNVDMNTVVFTEGKNPPRNEDAAGYNDTSWVLCDGSTDKFGKLHDGKGGGEIASQLVLRAALETDLVGKPLVDQATEVLAGFYRQSHPEALDNPQARFATTLVCARLAGDKLHVTQVGDSAFRINQDRTFFSSKKIDSLTARLRAQYIELTDDIKGSRDFIMPLLQNQLAYSNNPDHPLGYGVIDGTPVPERFIVTHEFAASEVQTLEIFSDGYYDIPDTASVEAYESLHARIEAEDPYKYKAYPATKPSDDRTVMIVRFQA